MRFAPTRLAVPIAMLVLAVAGCGGDTVTVQEVPGDPAPLDVPGGASGLAPAATATPEATATETPDAGEAAATATPDAATTQAQPEATPDADPQGAAEAPAQEESPTTEQAPPAGSDAEQFEDFCAENPGAC